MFPSGGAVAGFLSQYIGRRLTIMYEAVLIPHNAPTDTRLGSLFVLLVGAFIPLWILPDDFRALAAGAFCMQFGVQGALGVVSGRVTLDSGPPARAHCR